MRFLALLIFGMLACVAAWPAEPQSPLEGVWSWGSPRRSAQVPFLRITRAGTQWRIETKHYMKDHFVATTRDVRIEGNHVAFTYWYEPLARWSRCELEFTSHVFEGTCEGEQSAREWGPVPTYLWRYP